MKNLLSISAAILVLGLSTSVAALGSQIGETGGCDDDCGGGGGGNNRAVIKDNTFKGGAGGDGGNAVIKDNTFKGGAGGAGGKGGAGGAGGEGGDGYGLGIGIGKGGSAKVEDSGNSDVDVNTRTKTKTETSTKTKTKTATSTKTKQKQALENNIDARDLSVNTYEEAASTAYSAALTASAGTCMGSSSGGVQGMKLGVTVGTTWKDSSCDRRRDVATLVALHAADAAKALMCQKDSVRKAYALTETPCPQDTQAAEINTLNEELLATQMAAINEIPAGRPVIETLRSGPDN